MSGDQVFLLIFAGVVLIILAPELSRIRWVRTLGKGAAWLLKAGLIVVVFAAFFGVVYFVGNATTDWLGPEGEKRLATALTVGALIWLTVKVDELGKTNQSLERRLERLKKDVERRLSLTR